MLELVFLGLILEVLSGGNGAPLLKWPLNFGIGLVLVLSLLIVHFGFKSRPIVKWLSSIPAAISAICFFALVVLLLGFIPQDIPDANHYLSVLGLTHMKRSWLMMVSGLYLLFSLGLVSLRRVTPISRRNMGFLLNHVGLWITIAAGYFGAGDLMRLNLTVIEGHAGMNQAVDPRTQASYTLPFSVQLLDFNIDYYQPKLTILDGRTGDLILEKGKPLPFIELGLQAGLLGWEMNVEEYLPEAFQVGEQYIAGDSTGNAPAAYIRAVHTVSGEEKAGWISSGSFRVNQGYMQLDHHHYLGMIPPEPERFLSEILIEGGAGEALPLTLEVNKPYKHKGWKLYQLSYDDRMGKWSRVSVLEAVRDPWLPVVYAGVFLMLAGALYLFWIGQEIKE